MKEIKKIIKKCAAAALVLSLLLLSGCVPHTELNEKAIVMAITIDYKDEKYYVSFQYYNPTLIFFRNILEN